MCRLLYSVQLKERSVVAGHVSWCGAALITAHQQLEIEDMLYSYIERGRRIRIEQEINRRHLMEWATE
jgi:hypothetical protein